MKLKLFEIVNDRDKTNLNEIQETLNNKNCIRDWAYILHDKDETRPHYHIAVRLKDSYDTKYICEWFGIAENFINKVKGRWSDMLKYLIHENAPDKHQYDDSLVVSNFDWKKEKNRVNTEERLKEIIDMIDNGKIREYNYYDYITMFEFHKYKRAIDDAFTYRKDKLKGVSREMECVFITGDSGVGKSTYAKELAKNKDCSIYVSSGSNDVLDDYKGQDCIILDDLRPSCMGLSDLLKMLDNHTASTVKSRYKNKILECRLIIITTTLDINTFFDKVFSEEIETSIQLKRRCTYHVRMTMEYIYAKTWMNVSRKYGEEFKFPNPIMLEHNIKDMTKEEQLEKISEMFGASKDIVDDYKNNFDEYEQCDLKDLNKEN